MIVCVIWFLWLYYVSCVYQIGCDISWDCLLLLEVKLSLDFMILSVGECGVGWYGAVRFRIRIRVSVSISISICIRIRIKVMIY